MRTQVSSAILLASLTASSAFLAPVPKSNTRAMRTSGRMSMMLEGVDVASTLLALSKENDVFVKTVGEYPWGSVQAPEWVLPAATISILSVGAIVPLFLKDGVDAFNSGGPATSLTPAKAAAVKKAGATPVNTKVAPTLKATATPAKKPTATTTTTKKPATTTAFPWQKKPAATTTTTTTTTKKPVVAAAAGKKPTTTTTKTAAAPAKKSGFSLW